MRRQRHIWSIAAVPKLCSADPEESADTFL